MSIPDGLMPGSGGFPGAGGPPAGGQPGQPPQNPLGDPEQALRILSQMQQAPPQSGEDELFQQASNALGTLYSRIAGRSAEAAQVIGECIPKIQKARKIIQGLPGAPLSGPPNLGSGAIGGGPSPTGPPPGMGF